LALLVRSSMPIVGACSRHRPTVLIDSRDGR